MELDPEIYFSETEFEQAGLLHQADSCYVAPSSGFNVDISRNQRQQPPYSLYSLPARSCGLADRLQTLSECWQVHWPGQASTPSLPDSTETQNSTLGQEVSLQIPPIPEETRQPRNSDHQHRSAAALSEHTTDLPEPLRSVPVDLTTDAIRKQTNRYHQKRHRLRQKVTFEQPCFATLCSTHKTRTDRQTCCFKQARNAMQSPLIN